MDSPYIRTVTVNSEEMDRFLASFLRLGSSGSNDQVFSRSRANHINYTIYAMSILTIFQKWLQLVCNSRRKLEREKLVPESPNNPSDAAF